MALQMTLPRSKSRAPLSSNPLASPHLKPLPTLRRPQRHWTRMV